MNKENEFQAGRNIFKIDGPIGRKRFILTYIMLIFYTVLFFITLNYVYQLLEETFILKIASSTILILYVLMLFYTIAINYIKRIYDITKNKEKAIFYTIALLIFNVTTSVIQPLKLVGAIISTIVFAFCLLKKGQLTQPHNNADEQQQA